MNSETRQRIYQAFREVFPDDHDPYPGDVAALGRIIEQAKASHGLERLLAMNAKQTDHLEMKCNIAEQTVYKLGTQLGRISMAAELYHRNPKAAQWKRLMAEITKE